MYEKVSKPLIDTLLSFLILILLSPLILFLIVVLTMNLKGNPFFIQVRPGKNEKLFKIYKFKSMNDKKDAIGNLLADSERLTFIGKFIRMASLDEILQLFNVLKGDMSLIGPRPLLIQYLPLYNEIQKHRHDVRPGITGWAQVNGRNAISWKDKFEYDIWYVDNVSFALDVKIILLTIKKVFKSEGINQVGQATAEAFNGNN